MSESTDQNDTKEIIWTPQMPDRRKNDRRGDARELFTNGKALNVDSRSNDERRRGDDRRKKVSVTITGRAMDVEHDQKS